jgi:hypothetical protein
MTWDANGPYITRLFCNDLVRQFSHILENTSLIVTFVQNFFILDQH